MKLRIYLDDERETPQGWIRTYTVDETITVLATGQVDELSLDHDLGTDLEDGYDVLLWIEREVILHNFQPPILNVHSANPPAAKRMWAAIESIERKGTRT